MTDSAKANDLLAQLPKGKGPAPVHLWNPDFCGDIDMRIARDGNWFYLGTPIGRKAMVKLFSNIIRRDGNDYFLITPVEKVGIKVDDAPFVAVIQIIVYAGAIMVLFLFVVMLLNAPQEETQFDERVHPLLREGPTRFGGTLALALVVELVWALTRRPESGPFSGTSVSSVGAIGRALFTEYAFAFEVTSVLILVAMVGAVVLARRDPVNRDRTTARGDR